MNKNAAPTFVISTLGCRVNQYESEAVAGLLTREGFVPAAPGEPADVAIVNTCAVTAESERKSRQLLRRLRSENPDAVVVAAGCSAELSESGLSKIPGVDLICGNGAKDRIPDLVKEALRGRSAAPSAVVPDLSRAPYDGLVLTDPARARAYVKIEDGCGNKCAYCVIPRVRGPVRSKDEDAVLREIGGLLEKGVREVILTGIETGSYGEDLPRRAGERPLVSLLRRVASLGVPRIGLGSLDPTVLTPEFVGAVRETPAILPHFHISVQCGSSEILRRMRRRYSADMLADLIGGLRAAVPDVTLSADVIAGFPGEDETLFSETVDFVRTVRFLHLHVFPYSERPGTEAAEMGGQVPVFVRKERVSRLTAIGNEIKAEILARYAEEHAAVPVRVLAEKCSRGTVSGHSEHWIEVLFPGTPSDAGGEIEVYTREAGNGSVTGKKKELLH